MLYQRATLRIPILPLNESYGNVKVNQKYFLQEIEQLKTINTKIVEKYQKRMSYRTTPLNGMVSENIVDLFDGKTELSINDIKIQEKVLLTNHLEKLSYKEKLRLNPLIKKSSKYFKLETKENFRYIEKSDTVEELFNELSVNDITVKDLIESLTNTLNISTEDIESIILELINSNFIILDYTSESLDTILVRDRKKDIVQSFNVNNNDLLKIYKIIQKFSGINELEGYSELTDYFFEKYNNYLIPLEEVLKDEALIDLCCNVRYEYYYENELFEYLNHLAQRNNNKEEINLSLKEIPDCKNDIGSVDIHLNVLDNKYNLDNLRTVKNIGSTNLAVKQNLLGINLSTEDKGLATFMPPLKSNNLNINIYSRSGYNISDLYVGYNVNKKILSIYNAEKELINIRKLTNLSMLHYTPQLRALLLLGDINNLDKNIIHPKLYDVLLYIPRLVIDNKYIIIRRTWIIGNVFGSRDSLKDYIDNLLLHSKIELYVVYIKEDQEIILNLKEDFDYIFKEYRLYNKIILKELLSSQLNFSVDENIHNNELIYSFIDNDLYSQSEKNEIINEYDLDNDEVSLRKWKYYKVYLYEYNMDVVEFLVNLRKVFQRFFYVNYKDNNKEYLRIRFYKEDTLSIESYFNQSELVEYYILEPYFRENLRYKDIGIENFEQISLRDTNRILSFYNKFAVNSFSLKEMSTEILVCNTLSLIEEFKLKNEQVLKAFRRYKVGNCNRKRLTYITDVIRDRRIDFDEKIIQSNYDISNIEEVLSIIHMSNNRIMGVDIEKEREVYKYIYIYFEKLYWRQKNE